MPSGIESSSDSDVLALVCEVDRRIGTITTLVSPNEPIAEFECPDASFHEYWRTRLGQADRNSLVEVAAELLAVLKLPAIMASEAPFEHLQIYHRVSRAQEGLRDLISAAMAKGYPHSMTVFAKSSEIAPQLNKITEFLSKIDGRIEFIEKQSELAKLEEGITFTVGPVGVTLGALRLAVSRAWGHVSAATLETNVSALTEALAAVASSSLRLLNQLSEFAYNVPRNVKQAVTELSRLGQEAAKRGFELLRRSKSGQTQADRVSEQSLESQPADESVARMAKELGASLRRRRLELGQPLGDRYGRTWLGIRTDYLEAIEDGNYDQLPEDVYVIGYVKAYARDIGVEWSDIEPKVRHILRHRVKEPQRWDDIAREFSPEKWRTI